MASNSRQRYSSSGSTPRQVPGSRRTRPTPNDRRRHTTGDQWRSVPSDPRLSAPVDPRRPASGDQRLRSVRIGDLPLTQESSNRFTPRPPTQEPSGRITPRTPRSFKGFIVAGVVVLVLLVGAAILYFSPAFTIESPIILRLKR